MKKLFFVLFLALASAYPLVLMFRSTSTILQVDRPVKVVGLSTPIRVIAVNPHGIREFTAAIEQAGKSYPVFAQQEPPIRWTFFRDKQNPRTYVIDPGTKNVSALKEGKARLVVSSVSNDLRAAKDRLDFDIEVNTQPPVLLLDKYAHDMVLGGSQVITFSVGGYVTESGVKAGKYTFRSFPYGGKRICFFAAPYDLPEGEYPVVFARNPSGAEVVEKVKGDLRRRTFRRRQIVMDDHFFNKVLLELDKDGKGDPVARFVKVNNDMRQANNQNLADLRMATEEKILWNGPFRQLSKSVAEAQFCDYRTYFYKGQSVDQQVHMGFDLAGMKRMPVNAANDGKVVFAAPFGIYGNAIVIDHGYGIQTLYAHLSQIQVQVGQSVKKNDTIARTGTTGMAVGDHLHFSVQVDGVQVDPNQWWDPKWVKANILDKLE